MSDVSRRERALAELRPYSERARGFSGWNFDHLNVRNVEPPPPWDYVALAREHATVADRAVDLGTGGGEVYERIVTGQRGRFFASEEWHVNAPVARDRLRPLGVQVLHGSSEVTPWRDASFDLILSRHEAIVPEEVVRILRPGGAFLTQQVDARQLLELSAFFPRRTVFPDHYVLYQQRFEAAGLQVTSRRHTWRAAYRTLGDIAFMLMVAPWEIPDFDHEADIDALLALEDAHGTEQGIVLTLSRYVMTARKSP